MNLPKIKPIVISKESTIKEIDKSINHIFSRNNINPKINVNCDSKTINLVKNYFYGFEDFFLKFKRGVYSSESCSLEFNKLYNQTITSDEFKSLADTLTYNDIRYIHN